MRYYDFVDKAPAIPGLVVVEGDEPLLSQRAIDAILERLLPPDVRALNADIFDGPTSEAVGQKVADAVNAMPFLAERRVVVVRNAHLMRAQPRRELWEAAQNVPAGNTLVLEDLAPPRKTVAYEAFGQLAGRKGLRIDTTRNANVRAKTSCDLFVLDKADFSRILRDNPTFAAAMGHLVVSITQCRCWRRPTG